MTIEIHQPELEALILERMESGAFRNVEEVLMQALRSAPLAVRFSDLSNRTGAALVAAMQASPYKELDLEPSRPHLPVRDIAF